MGQLADFPFQKRGISRSINAENPHGEKGRGGMAASRLGAGRKGSPCLHDIAPGETVTLARIDGTGIINHIWITVDNKTSDADCFVLRDLVLRMYWDENDVPAVEVPLGDFFCCGFGMEYPVHSEPIVMIPKRGLNSYIPMPFSKSAKITLENQHRNLIPSFFYQIDYNLYDSLPENSGYFHAQWRRQRMTELKKDYIILDGVRGKGTYFGTFLGIQTLERYWWGEGEMKFYLDGDADYPTICGTGTEDYFGGSWSFAAKRDDGRCVEETYSTAYLGYPFYSKSDTLLKNSYHNDDVPPMRAFYRFHIPDPIFFESDIKVTIQQIGVSYKGLFERQDDVTSVAYWYQEDDTGNTRCELPSAEERWPR